MTVRQIVDATNRRIGWGGYDRWEGPWFKGTVPFVLPSKPSFLDKVLATVTATEGGHLDAYNGYDRCKCTSGVIQWGEVCAPYSVTKMIALCAERNFELASEFLFEAGLAITKDPDGWWLCLLDGRRVRQEATQNEAFLGGSSGLKKGWNDLQKARAKRTAAVISSLWSIPQFAEAQMEFTRPRLLDFAMGNGRMLFMNTEPEAFEGWRGALRAGYLSFAANLPAVAARRVTTEILAMDTVDSKEACIKLLRECTFGPRVAIYPHRYDKIRPVLEAQFGVDLPDFSHELAKWKQNNGETLAPKEIQEILVSLGYDIGPSGADGKIGPKTTLAIISFQKARGLDADGIVGPMTTKALLRERTTT